MKNCIGAGLACGFLEPLESTGIAMIDVAVDMLGEIFPRNGEAMEAAARLFNKVMTTRFELAVVFLKIHYGLSSSAPTAPSGPTMPTARASAIG